MSLLPSSSMLRVLPLLSLLLSHTYVVDAIDCGCPDTCTPEAQAETNGAAFSCGARISYMMAHYGASELDACTAASRSPDTPEENYGHIPCLYETCHPEKCGSTLLDTTTETEEQVETEVEILEEEPTSEEVEAEKGFYWDPKIGGLSPISSEDTVDIGGVEVNLMMLIGGSVVLVLVLLICCCCCCCCRKKKTKPFRPDSTNGSGGFRDHTRTGFQDEEDDDDEYDEEDDDEYDDDDDGSEEGIELADKI